jgi:hypothetical protein
MENLSRTLTSSPVPPKTITNSILAFPKSHIYNCASAYLARASFLLSVSTTRNPWIHIKSSHTSVGLLLLGSDLLRVNPHLHRSPPMNERCLWKTVIVLNFSFCKNDYVVLTNGAKLLVQFSVWWHSNIRVVPSPVTCKTTRVHRELAGETPFENQVSA